MRHSKQEAIAKSLGAQSSFDVSLGIGFRNQKHTRLLPPSLLRPIVPRSTSNLYSVKKSNCRCAPVG